jgi:glucan 1,3-beta-glucosidase
MWLNGFNDNLPGFPKMPCKFVPCPDPYVVDQTGAPPDPTKALQPPYGTGVSGPSFGLCPTDIDWKDTSGSTAAVQQPGGGACTLADEEFNNEVTMQLARKKLHAWSEVSHGFYMWTFRTELAPRWDFLEAHSRGWIPLTLKDLSHEVAEACDKEDQGLFLCHAKRGIFESTIIAGMDYCCGYNPDCEGTNDGLTGYDLLHAADKVFNDYWSSHRTMGTTCDFGGAAEIVDLPVKNNTAVDDGFNPVSEASILPTAATIGVQVCSLAVMSFLSIAAFLAVKFAMGQKKTNATIQVGFLPNFGSTGSSAIELLAVQNDISNKGKASVGLATGGGKGGSGYARIGL